MIVRLAAVALVLATLPTRSSAQSSGELTHRELHARVVYLASGEGSGVGSGESRSRSGEIRRDENRSEASRRSQETQLARR